MFKKILSFIIFLLVAFTTYLVLHTLAFKTRQISVQKVSKIEIDSSAVRHLSEAIKIKTISPGEIADFDSSQFVQLVDFLANTYPLADSILSKTNVNDLSLLYEWKGQDSEKKPVVLTAHMDVVPVTAEELQDWKAPPFSGIIRKDTIWGRGTLDDKVSVIGIMEAVEYLLAHGYAPDRTIYLAFGHDEELGGMNGAQEIVKVLQGRGIDPEFVLDEGYTLTQGLVPGVLTDVAMIGIAEKGFASLTLTTDIDGGHSSMPGEQTAILSISEAISKISGQPFPTELCEPVHLFLDHVGPEMRFQEKLVFANRNLFKSAIINAYSKSAPGRAVIQTTMAPTMFNSGIKENVIPTAASATINFRILPGTSIEQLISHIQQTINDESIQIELGEFYSEPSHVSSIETHGYATINKTIREVFPEAITAPNLLIAATDGRHYSEICKNIYRFLPVYLSPDNIKAIHGINECIAVHDFENAIRFYVQLIRNCG